MNLLRKMHQNRKKDLIDTYNFQLVFEKQSGKSFIKNLDEALYQKTGLQGLLSQLEKR